MDRSDPGAGARLVLPFCSAARAADTLGGRIGAPPGIARPRPRRPPWGPGRGARGVSGRHVGRGAGGGASGGPGQAQVGAARPAPCAPRRAPGPARRRHIWKRSARPPGARRAGGRGGGPRGERRAPRSCPRLPLAASAETAPARAARGAARSGGAFLPPRPRDSLDLWAENAEQGRGGRAESGRRRFGPAAGGLLPSWGRCSPLPLPPPAQPLHLFFQMLWPPEVRC